jgi:hypothetical protein
MSRRGRLKRTKYRIDQQQRIHDRTSAVIPHNAKVFVDEVDDAWGEIKPAEFDPKRQELRFEGRPRANVIRSTRDDPLSALKAQGVISEVQFLAGQRWSWAHMRSEIGGVRGIDTTRTKVDGGQLPEPLNETVKRALVDLRKARDALGEDGTALVADVLGKGLTLAKAADARGLVSKSGREYVGRRFRECLDRLAIVFGLATPAPVLERA